MSRVPRWVWACAALAAAGIPVAVVAPSVPGSETRGVVISSIAATVAVMALFAIAAWGIAILLYEATKNG